MKFLLVYFIAVRISTEVCAYRRHGTPSRNAASFFLRKVCVEVAGNKEEIADLKEEIADLKEENAGFKEEIADLKENTVMKQPVDGQWINWMQWSGCSVTCGPGTRTRQRLCLDPRPSNGGSDCTGSASETDDCEIISCEGNEDTHESLDEFKFQPDTDTNSRVAKESSTHHFKSRLYYPVSGNVSSVRMDASYAANKLQQSRFNIQGLDKSNSGIHIRFTDPDRTKSSSPYSAFALFGVTPTYVSPVLIWPSTRLNIAPDNGAHYNTSSGKYCAEFYGTYIFILHLYKTGLREIAVCHIVKDDGSSRETLGTTEVQDGTITGSTSTILVLEKGDCVYVGNCGGYSLLSTLSSFSGALLDSLE